MIGPAETIILLKLLAAHLLADFLLQPRSWIERKRRDGLAGPHLYYHTCSVAVLTWLLLGDWTHVGLPLFIGVTHLIIDRWKISRPDKARFFVMDQLGHLATILAGWTWYGGLGDQGLVLMEDLLSSAPFWIVAVSYIIVIWPFGYLVALITDRWQQELIEGDRDRIRGLGNAGMWIGRAERFLILTFILMNQYGAIGFLIAAKSIFRFSGRLEGDRDRKEAEYILIGTLLSFALSISVGIGAAYLLGIS